MKKTLLITAVMLILAATIGYLALRPGTPDATDAPKKWTPEALVPKETPIIRIGFKGPKADVVLQWAQEINNWVVVKPRRSLADLIYIKPFVKLVGELKKEKIIAIDPPDLSIYQLDQPPGELTVEFADDRPPLRLLIGKSNYNQDALYAKLADQPTVFLVSAGLRQYLAATDNSFRSSRLMLHEPPVIGAIEFEVLDPKLQQQFPQLENYKLVKQQNTRIPAWFFVAPFSERANVNKVIFFLTRNTMNTTDQIIDIDDDNYAPYGFDHPTLRITLTDDKGSAETIEFGTFDPEKKVFYGRNLSLQEVMVTGSDYYSFVLEPNFRFNHVLFPEQGHNPNRFTVEHPADHQLDFNLVREDPFFFHFENDPARKSSIALIGQAIDPFSNREIIFLQNMPPYDRAAYGLETPKLGLKAYEGETKFLDVACGNTVNIKGLTYTYIEDLNRNYIAALPVNVYQDLPVTSEHLTMSQEDVDRILRIREKRKLRKQSHE